MANDIHPVLERVARAIARECNFLGGEDSWKSELLAARAAIQALLEPDEGMVEAGNAAGAEAYQYQQFGVVVCPPAKAYAAILKPLLGDEG